MRVPCATCNVAIRNPNTQEREICRQEKMSVTVTLSEQQAALLIPFLEQLKLPPHTTTQISPTTSTTSAVLDTASTAIVSSSDQHTRLQTSVLGSERRPYSSEELLKKKSKNTKSTEAQSVMNVSHQSVHNDNRMLA